MILSSHKLLDDLLLHPSTYLSQVTGSRCSFFTRTSFFHASYLGPFIRHGRAFYRALYRDCARLMASTQSSQELLQSTEHWPSYHHKSYSYPGPNMDAHSQTIIAPDQIAPLWLGRMDSLQRIRERVHESL